MIMCRWQAANSKLIRRIAVMTMAMATLGVATGVALAQNNTANTNGQAAGNDPLAENILPQLGELFMHSPVINGLILGLSVIALMMFLLFMLTINTRAMAPADLTDEVIKLARRKQFNQAADLCRVNRRTFSASVMQRCLENAKRDHATLMDIIESEGRRRADVLWNRISYLADVSNVAPMLGLFGTVVGMIKAFAASKYQSLDASADALTDGIAQAMSTTMFGLAVGILALVLYTLIKGRATRTLADVEAAVHNVTDNIQHAGAESDDRGQTA